MDDLVACPNCQASLPLSIGLTKLTCRNCEWEFETLHHLCPSCDTYHHQEAAICLECGTPLARVCQNCRTTNWSGRRTCSKCASTLDLLETIMGYQSSGTSNRLQQQMAEARVLKAIERQDSEQRMAAFHELDRVRRKSLHDNLMKRKRQDKTILVVTFLAVGLFIIALLTYSLIN